MYETARVRTSCVTVVCSSCDRVSCLCAKAMAYSATTVLPAEVCAATNTLSPCAAARHGERAVSDNSSWHARSSMLTHGVLS